jgi:hypothetical protein
LSGPISAQVAAGGTGHRLEVADRVWLADLIAIHIGAERLPQQGIFGRFVGV